jgi:hypothetical protein
MYYSIYKILKIANWRDERNGSLSERHHNFHRTDLYVVYDILNESDHSKTVK